MHVHICVYTRTPNHARNGRRRARKSATRGRHGRKLPPSSWNTSWLCRCVCVCVCVYILSFLFIHMCMTYVCITYINIYVVYISVCITYIYICVTYICITYINIYVLQIYMYHMHTCSYMHINVYIYTYP